MTQPKKPAAELKCGLITASIWKNESDKGKTHYSVTFNRAYRSGEKWKRTGSFGPGDLPGLAKLADQAHAKIDELAAADRSKTPESE